VVKKRMRNTKMGKRWLSDAYVHFHMPKLFFFRDILP
jgi:hypothetical protein